MLSKEFSHNNDTFYPTGRTVTYCGVSCQEFTANRASETEWNVSYSCGSFFVPRRATRADVIAQFFASDRD